MERSVPPIYSFRVPFFFWSIFSPTTIIGMELELNVTEPPRIEKKKGGKKKKLTKKQKAALGTIFSEMINLTKNSESCRGNI
jgi:hypothetical protein